MSRRGRLLLATVIFVGCEPTSEPLASGASSAEATAADQVRRAKKLEDEYVEALRAPDRLGHALLRTWVVTTPRIAESAKCDHESILEGTGSARAECGSNVSRVYPRVKVWATRIEVWHGETLVFSREYDVVRDSGSELEIQLRDGGERAVLALLDEGKQVQAPDLVWLLGGAHWRAAPWAAD